MIKGIIRNKSGEKLDYVFEAPKGSCDVVVIIGHGVTSHHARPWLIALSDAVAMEGFGFLRFSFSGNGESDGLYEEATISKEFDDLGAVVDACGDYRVVYAGHSMGGAIGVLRCAVDARLMAFVSLAGMTHISDFMVRWFGKLEPGVDVMLEKEECPLSQEFLDDAHHIGDVFEAAKLITIPWLVVHGDADEIVPFQDALDVQAVATGPFHLVTMRGVDHRYTNHEEAMARYVVDWLDSVVSKNNGHK